MSKAYYFLAPTRNSPPNGPIRIGNIIDNVSEPERPINDNAPPAFTDKNRLYESTNLNWQSSRLNPKTRKAGLWTSFLAALGIRAEANITSETNRVDGYEIDKLTTTEFIPSKQYLQESIDQPDVKNWMLHNKNEPLWMITGVKIASGARFLVSRAKEKGFHLQFGFDATGLGYPVAAGPQVEAVNKIAMTESARAGEDFVFAYRLREIRYSGRKGLTSRDLTDKDGAWYEVGRPHVAPDDEEDRFLIKGSNIPLQDIVEEDIEDDFTAGDVDDDGTTVRCIVVGNFYLGN